MPKYNNRRQQSPPSMVNTVPILVACLVVGVPLLLYVAFLGLSVNPFFQRQ